MKDQFIGLMAEDRPALVVGLLAILKSGNAFVPINPVFPDERVHFILNDCNIRVLVTDDVHYTRGLRIARESRIIRHLLCIEGVSGQITARQSFADRTPVGETAARETVPCMSTSPCYVIYTSGSTGRPKGVPITHENLAPLLLWFGDYFRLGGQTKIFHNLSYTFDFGVFEILTTVIFGGSMYMLDKKDSGGFSYYADFIASRGIDTIHTTPAFFAGMAAAGKKMPSLGLVHLGGENLSGGLAARVRELTGKNCRIYNGYGPTEATINCSVYRVPEGRGQELAERESIPIGRPSAWNRVYILDHFQRLQPVGVPGELCVGGIGLAGGYLNRPELTVERFKHDLWAYRDCHEKKSKSFFEEAGGQNGVFSKKAPLVFYKTGDLARWLDDGNIEFLGRLDQQVKIRGYRIELGEIENRLLKNNGIKEAVVMARRDENRGQRYLCAYITPREGPAGENLTVSELREQLLEELPEYMIPAYFIKLEKIPLTTNGKIDWRALPTPSPDRIMPGEGYSAPANETEQKMAAIWQEILGIDRIGREDDFFESGGDSILANKCIARLREEFNVDISLRKIFECPSIKLLSKEIAVPAPRQEEVISIPKAQRDGSIPLSFSQERLWFLRELDADNVAYFVPRVIRMKGKLEPTLIERTFTEIIRRHEILRTVFPTVDGQPAQRIQPPHPFKIPLLDWSRSIKEEQELEVTHFLNEENRRPFDFEKGPLLRVTIIKLKEEEHLFVLTEHHLIHDGWTQGVLLKEFIAIFTAYSQGKEHSLPELPIQYADYSIWQRWYLQGERLRQYLAYWREKLSGLNPVLGLPTDRPRPAVMSGKGALKDFRLPSTLTNHLKKISREHGVSLFMTMLAVFKVLLYRCTGVEDLCVGAGIANRSYKEMEGMLGMVINTLPLRTHTVGELTFIQYLGRVKETCLEAYQRQDTPFGKIVEALGQQRSLSYNPVFQVIFTFMDTPTDDLLLPGLELHLEPTHNRSAKFDINLVLVPPRQIERAGATGENDGDDGEILVEWEYNTDIFDAPTMERMIGHYIRLLEEIIHHADVSISNLAMLDSREIHRLLVEWNDTGAEYPEDKTIQRLFEEQAAKTPDHVSLVGATAVETPHAASLQIQMSYRQLNEQSDRLARVLIEKGVLADNVVGIMMERSTDLIIGILGILKSGGAYLPIDPVYPQERIQYMLEDSNTKILLATEECQKEIIINCQLLIINCKLKNLPMAPFHHPSFILNGRPLRGLHHSSFIIHHSNQLAYIIYTSGSTGRPKGVAVEHSQLVNFVYHMVDKYDGNVDCNDRCLSLTNIMFDVSVWEFFLPLLFGARIVLMREQNSFDVFALTRAILEEGITLIYLPPGLLKPVHEQLKKQPGRLRLNKMLVGVEPIRDDVLEDYIRLNPGMKIINGYGPTETTICASSYNYSPHQPKGEIVSIGVPLSNNRIILVDAYDHIVPQGIPGEICISGDGVSRGYINNPELTAKKYSPHPYFKCDRMYRTGDIARFLPDGNLFFIGRRDNQLKIRGYRIELGEIEIQIIKHKRVKEAVVVVNEDAASDKSLTAYIVSTGELLESELREHLQGKIPDYMIPSHFITLEKIPLTPNGKLDRRALPKPMLKSRESYSPPRDNFENKLVDIWSEVLDRDELPASRLKTSIGIDDNFFHLGGHSLKATILVSKIHKAFQVNVPLTEIFKSPTIRSLSQYLKAAEKADYVSLEPTEKKEYYELSSAQKRLYVLHRMDEQGTGYNIPAFLALEGKVDKDRLEQTFKLLIDRHESLRTSFHMINDALVQRIHNKVEFCLATEVITETEERVHHSSSIIHHFIQTFIRSFDLSKAPLLRVGLVKENEDRHIVIVDMHHIISDGTSMNILVKDIMALYQGENLPELRVQYKDFSEWRNNEKQGESIKRQGEYWLKEFEGEIPVLELPFDYTRPAVQSFEGSRIPFELDKEMTGALKRLTLEMGSTIYMLLLAVYTAFLAKITNQEEIIVGSPIAGRRHAALEKIVGMFVNTLALRNYPLGEKPFTGFLYEVKEKTLSAFENQDYHYEDLVEKVAVKRDTARNPLFDTMFVLQNMDMAGINIPGLNVFPYPHENKTAKFDLTLSGEEKEGKLIFTFEYGTKLFREETVNRFINYFKNIVTSVIEKKERKIADFEIIAEEEKKRILFDFNDTTTGYPIDKTIHQLFEEQASRAPDRIAVVGAGAVETLRAASLQIQMSYRQLNEQSDRLAGLLIEKGVLPDNIVGIMMERSVEIIIGIFGILKSGGAYLPIDPEYPKERIQYMLEDSNTKILLATEECQKEIIVNCQLLIINCKLKNLPKAPFHHPSFILKGRPLRGLHHSSFIIHHSNLSYLIYTSGSTGRPKGVMVSHRAVVNRLYFLKNQYRLNENDVVLQKTSFTFDASVCEIFRWILPGAKLCLLPPGAENQPEIILETIAAQEVTIMDFVPSALKVLLEFMKATNVAAKLHSLRWVLVGAEAVTPALAAAFYEVAAGQCNARLINVYGPTETAVDVTHFDCSSGEFLPVVPIGKPMANVRVYIIDKYSYLQPPGICGELCIAGDCLARGYANNPGLTFEKFYLAFSSLGAHHSSIYRTGDLARWLLDGNIEFLGRIDRQVKIRGFRIELGEIEFRLTKHMAIKEAVVLAQEENGDKYLCAYIVPGRELGITELREYLSLELPNYMIPSHFLQVEKIPLTANGKIDRKALASIKPGLKTRLEYVAPQDDIEEKIARVWKEVLKLDEISIFDNFFEIGGNSLNIVIINNKIKTVLNKEIPVIKMYAYPTINSLANYIAQEETDKKDRTMSLHRAGETAITENIVRRTRYRVGGRRSRYGRPIPRDPKKP